MRTQVGPAVLRSREGTQALTYPRRGQCSAPGTGRDEWVTPVSWEAGSYQPSCTWHGTGCLETQADGNPRTQTDLNSDAGPLQPLLLWVHFGSFQDPLVGVATMHADCCPDSRGQRRLGHLGAVSRPPPPILTSQGALPEEGSSCSEGWVPHCELGSQFMIPIECIYLCQIREPSQVIWGT